MRTPGASRLRTYAWTLLAAAFGVRIIAVAVDLPRPVRILLADGSSFLMPMLVVSVLALVLAVRPSVSGIDRGAAGILSAAAFTHFLAEASWTWVAAFRDPYGARADSFQTLLNGVAMLLLFLLLIKLTAGKRRTFAAQLGLVTDLLLVVGLLWPVAYVMWTLPDVTAVGGSAGDAGSLAFRSMFGLAIVGFTLVVVALNTRRRWTAREVFAAIAFLLFGAGLTAVPWWYVDNLRGAGYEPSLVVDLMGMGYGFMLMAVVYRATDGSSSDAVPLDVTVPSWLTRGFRALVGVALLLFGYVLVALAGRAEAVPVEVGTFALAILLVMRSWATAIARVGAWNDATTDPATGVYNQVVLRHHLSDAIDAASEEGRELSIVVFDVTETRQLEDLYGVAETESLVKRMTSVMVAEAPIGAEVFRVGSEEFVVVMRRMGTSEASAYARRVWLGLSHGKAGRSGAMMDLAAGVATFPVHAVKADGLLAAAEVARTSARSGDLEPIAVYGTGLVQIDAAGQQNRARMRTLRATVRALAEAVDARDPATRDHSVNVSELATALAQVLNLPDERVQIVGLAALVHDVGKIGIRDDVLLKAGSLDVSERGEVEEHPVLGEMILGPAQLDEIPSFVRWHHERWDGRGYPDGLAGEEIPLEARILAVCDAFETITTGRPYREPLSFAEALDEIEASAGSQFDPHVAAAFVRMVTRLRARPHPFGPIDVSEAGQQV